MEKLDVYNERGEKTGRVILRNEPVMAGERLLIVHLCVFNRRGEMLIQRRQRSKDRYPDRWDVSAGGFARSGETSREAVLRECAEELGLTLKAGEPTFILTEPFSYVLDDFFMAVVETDAKKLSFQREEISELRWASGAELLRMIETGEFVDYSAAMMEKLLAYSRAALKL